MINKPNLLPKKLIPGDKIGIVAPSAPITLDMEDSCKKGVGFLENLGFQVVFGKNVRSTTWTYTAAPQEKADDINSMFADKSISAIICAQGGKNANACLPLLDWGVIEANPKIFMGISDISVLLNPIHSRTGLITFHGNDLLWGFGRKPSQYDEHEFRSILMEGRLGAIPPDRPRRMIRGGSAQGKLMGGNLNSLMRLAGTSFFPDLTDSVLCVEGLDITPEICDQSFQQLKQMGVFEKIRGVIVGYVYRMQRTIGSAQMEDILLRVTADYSFPILKVEDFGHHCPNTVLPFGGLVRVDADQKTIELVEKVVS